METLTDKQRERALNKFLYYKTYYKNINKKTRTGQKF